MFKLWCTGRMKNNALMSSWSRPNQAEASSLGSCNWNDTLLALRRVRPFNTTSLTSSSFWAVLISVAGCDNDRTNDARDGTTMIVSSELHRSAGGVTVTVHPCSGLVHACLYEGLRDMTNELYTKPCSGVQSVCGLSGSAKLCPIGTKQILARVRLSGAAAANSSSSFVGDSGSCDDSPEKTLDDFDGRRNLFSKLGRFSCELLRFGCDVIVSSIGWQIRNGCASNISVFPSSVSRLTIGVNGFTATLRS